MIPCAEPGRRSLSSEPRSLAQPSLLGARSRRPHRIGPPVEGVVFLRFSAAVLAWEAGSRPRRLGRSPKAATMRGWQSPEMPSYEILRRKQGTPRLERRRPIQSEGSRRKPRAILHSRGTGIPWTYAQKHRRALCIRRNLGIDSRTVAQDPFRHHCTMRLPYS